MTFVIVAVVLVVIVVPIISYNRFVQQRALIANSWANIDTELKRRHDLIPNLVETVKGYAAHESSIFDTVIAARNAAHQAPATALGRASAEPAFERSIGSLFALAEGYPDLKANTNFLALQAELTTTEDRLAAARRFYNGNVRDFNRRLQSVPSNIIASVGGFVAADYFQIDAAERTNPSVK